MAHSKQSRTQVTFDRTDEFPEFGAKYTFSLEDAIDDCPEYLVHFTVFKRYVLWHNAPPRPGWLGLDC
jgi:hypothetical protein